MILSRRSFLKVAGLTVVAAAGASMFTGCSITSLFMTPVVYSCNDGKVDEDTIKKLNANNTTKGVPGGSSKYSDPKACVSAVENQLRGAVKLGVKEADGIKVVAESTKLAEKQENGKTVYYISAVVTK